MLLTISFQHNDTVLSVDVSSDMTLGDLKAYIEAESSVPVAQQILIYKTSLMANDSLPLSNWNIAENDLLVLAVQPSQNTASESGSGLSGTNSSGTDRLYADVERVRTQMLDDQVLRQGVQQTYPQLIEVINDPLRFREVMIEIERKRVQEENARQQELKRLQDDPYNEESQQKILELIQQDAVMENLNAALEHNPEVFGRVTMLFVEVMVNGHPVKAFVDSGAQSTIMSTECVEACDLTHLIDKRFQGIAKGVGTAKILGRVHSAPLKFGNAFLPCSLTIMDQKNVDLLLGLDMLKRHQGLIDLKRNVLVLGDSEVPFLPESDIPAKFQDENAPAPNAPGMSSVSRVANNSQTSGSGLTSLYFVFNKVF